MTIVLAAPFWRGIGPAIRAFVLSLLVLLLSYVFFYARYFQWGGDFAWGDRVVATPVQLAALLSTPLLLRYLRELRPFARKSAGAVLVVGVAIQIESTVFWYSLEPFQVRTLGHPTFVVGLRARNIVASALGKSEAWGLMNRWTLADRYHSLTPWFFVYWRTALVCCVRRCREYYW